jgi:hypothetical protein
MVQIQDVDLTFKKKAKRALYGRVVRENSEF